MHTRIFCTYLDKNYLPRGLALYRSLKRWCGSFQLWMLCLDEESHAVFSKLNYPEIQPIPLDLLEAEDPDLLPAKENRSRIEYYFTCTPAWTLFVLNHASGSDLVTYLDADLFFYSDPEPLFEEMGNRSIALIEHRLAPHLQHALRCGIYNVGWLSFRNDHWGRASLHWWRERCLEWCYDRCEPGRYADQKYLDVFPRMFANVAILRHKGANLAPWNLANYQLRKEGKKVLVDEDPLIFYHFHALKQLRRWLFSSQLSVYGVPSSSIIRRDIYLPYIRAVQREMRLLRRCWRQPAGLRSIRAVEKQSASFSLARMVRSLSSLDARKTSDYYLSLGL